MGKYSVVGTEVPKVMRHVASCTKGKHLGMHVQSQSQSLNSNYNYRNLILKFEVLKVFKT